MTPLSQFKSTSSPRRTPPSQAILDSIDQPQRSVNHPVVCLRLPLINDCANAWYINASLQGLLRTCRKFTASVFSLAMSVDYPLLFAFPLACLSKNLPSLLQLSYGACWAGAEMRDVSEFLTDSNVFFPWTRPWTCRLLSLDKMQLRASPAVN